MPDQGTNLGWTNLVFAAIQYVKNTNAHPITHPIRDFNERWKTFEYDKKKFRNESKVLRAQMAVAACTRMENLKANTTLSVFCAVEEFAKVVESDLNDCDELVRQYDDPGTHLQGTKGIRWAFNARSTFAKKLTHCRKVKGDIFNLVEIGPEALSLFPQSGKDKVDLDSSLEPIQNATEMLHKALKHVNHAREHAPSYIISIKLEADWLQTREKPAVPSHPNIWFDLQRSPTPDCRTDSVWLSVKTSREVPKMLPGVPGRMVNLDGPEAAVQSANRTSTPRSESWGYIKTPFILMTSTMSRAIPRLDSGIVPGIWEI